MKMIKNFYNLTGLNENNKKIIFFITDSNFDYLYKGIKKCFISRNVKK